MIIRVTIIENNDYITTTIMGITFIIWRFLNHGGTPIAGCLFAGKSTQKIHDFGVRPWIGQLQMMMVITMGYCSYHYYHDADYPYDNEHCI